MEAQASPLAQYGLTLISIAVIIVLGIVANAILRRFLSNLARRQYLSEPLHVMLHGISWWVVVIVVILMILQQAGVRVVGLWAGLLTVAGMVTIGFIAVWSVLSNILCALLLIVFAPFRIGDEIEIIEATGGKGLRGKVVSLNIMYTSIQELTDEGARDGITNVPNNIFFQKTIRQWQGANTTSLEANLFKESSSDG
jgi:small-conductance mechanosensitive channel